jgi:hypothetical protein
MAQKLNFHFNLEDPNAASQTNIVNPSDTNYIAHAFIKTPIYDDFNVQIGYKVSDDYIQQLSTNVYSVRINSTYFFFNNSTISWQYSFLNDKPTYFYPLNIPNTSNIISSTGLYLNKTGTITLIANKNGTRDVTINFN